MTAVVTWQQFGNRDTRKLFGKTEMFCILIGAAVNMGIHLYQKSSSCMLKTSTLLYVSYTSIELIFLKSIRTGFWQLLEACIVSLYCKFFLAFFPPTLLSKKSMGNIWQTIWIKIPLVLSNRTPIQSSLRTEVEWLAWGPRGDLAVTLFFGPLVPCVPRVLNPWALQRPCYGQWWVERSDALLQTGSWVTACHRGRLGVFLFKPFFPFVLFRKWCPWKTWRRTSGVRPWQKPLELLPLIVRVLTPLFPYEEKAGQRRNMLLLWPLKFPEEIIYSVLQRRFN